MNFFQESCQEAPINNIVFGLCDDQNGSKAYTNTDDKTKWVATVKNDSEIELIFTAIDKCVIKDNEETGRGRCDAMLTSKKHLYLIELKDSLPPWQTFAIEQLESTIKFLKEHHDISSFIHKKAFASNKKRDRFQVIDNEFNLKFFRKYGFRIDVQAEIVVI